MGQILNPLYQAVAAVLTFFYSLVPNYAVAISLLTITVMAILSPLTLKSTRSMLAMQRLAPEVKKLQQKYKTDRQKLNEEMMALYRENNVSPLGGCLPMLLQLPVFLVLYGVIRGLTNTVTIAGHVVSQPKYISSSSLLYHDLKAAGGKMMSFGIDLSKSATSIHGGLAKALPFYILIVVAIGLQYLQMRQITARNPQAAAANPQMARMQKFFPLIFGIIYINIPAAVNIYFIVSNLFRIAQQELMFRFDPVVKTMASPGAPAPHELRRGRMIGGPAGVFGRLLGGMQGPGTGAKPEEEVEGPAQAGPEGRAGDQGGPKQLPKGAGDGGNGTTNGRSPARGKPGGDGRAQGNGKPKAHPRSHSKKPRKAR